MPFGYNRNYYRRSYPSYSPSSYSTGYSTRSASRGRTQEFLQLFESTPRDARSSPRTPPRQRTVDPTDSPTNEAHERRPRMMEDYKFIRSLPTGAMSIAINVVESRTNGRLYIEKQVATNDRHGPDGVKSEIAILKQISEAGRDHNLNTMLEHAPGRGIHHIILHYCNDGNLKQKIEHVKQRRGGFGQSFVWHVLISCINAIDFMHRGPPDRHGHHDPRWNTICHLDIKPANIFLHAVEDDDYPQVRLGDFGGAVSNRDIANGTAAPACTRGWDAPEMCGREHYGTKTDSWQLGGVIQAMCRLLACPDLNELASGRPCGGIDSEELNRVVSRLTNPRVRDRANVEEVLDIAERCLRARENALR